VLLTTPLVLIAHSQIIEMSSYTIEEKVQIARRHLLPKQLRLHGLTPQQLELDQATLDAVISGYTREAGVRELDRLIAAICRNIAARAVERDEANGDGEAPDRDSGTACSTDELSRVLGPMKFDSHDDIAQRLSKPGIVAGLAFTPVGGVMPLRGTAQPFARNAAASHGTPRRAVRKTAARVNAGASIRRDGEDGWQGLDAPHWEDR
jgi:ATP-dependent Lon protease